MKTQNSRKLLFVLISLVLVIVIIAGIVIWKYSNNDFDKYKASSGEINQTVSSDTYSNSVPLVENPIDFDEIQKENTDIYAWINIPNTKIDYPIVQSYAEDDLFYIDHNINKKRSSAGAIFTQKLNQRDFSDPNTLIYGHNMRNGTMFRHLHKFKKKDFFEENQYIYIYTRGHILTYHIFSAYEYDSRHILNSFDFTNKEVYAEYLKYIQNPTAMYKNTRDVKLTTDDKIITLSTCLANNTPDKRYLVQGVLIKDELTY